jgi:hypothetical protein
MPSGMLLSCLRFARSSQKTKKQQDEVFRDKKIRLVVFSKPVRQMPESFFSKLSYEHRPIVRWLFLYICSLQNFKCTTEA